KYLLKCRDVFLQMNDVGSVLLMFFFGLILYSISRATNYSFSLAMVISLFWLIPLALTKLAEKFADVEYPTDAKLLKPVNPSTTISAMSVMDRCLHVIWYICTLLVLITAIASETGLLNPRFFIPSAIGFILFGLLINRQGFKKLDRRLVKGMAIFADELVIHTQDQEVHFQLDRLISEYLSADVLKFVHKNANGKYEELEADIRYLSPEDKEYLQLMLS
ncbi:MAG: hypothetical protein AAFV25_18765, partial [Bacteroidota bacterium]